MPLNKETKPIDIKSHSIYTIDIIINSKLISKQSLMTNFLEKL